MTYNTIAVFAAMFAGELLQVVGALLCNPEFISRKKR
jgi:hypothetical protein